jgi:hypothetical protein
VRANLEKIMVHHLQLVKTRTPINAETMLEPETPTKAHSMFKAMYPVAVQMVMYEGSGFIVPEGPFRGNGRFKRSDTYTNFAQTYRKWVFAADMDKATKQGYIGDEQARTMRKVMFHGMKALVESDGSDGKQLNLQISNFLQGFALGPHLWFMRHLIDKPRPAADYLGVPYSNGSRPTGFSIHLHSVEEYRQFLDTVSPMSRIPVNIGELRANRPICCRGTPELSNRVNVSS